MTFPGGPVAPGLAPEHLQQLSAARPLWKKIRRAISMANFDGWATAIFAALTLLGGVVSFSWVALILGLGMAAVAYFEFRGARDLALLDPLAARRLGWNQVFFGAMLFTYAVYALITGLRDPARFAGVLSEQLPAGPQADEILGSIDKVVRMVLWALYGTLALVAITVQGGTALFYFAREKQLRSYLSQAAPWILEAQRAGMRI